jgi:chromosome segregation ATPase
MSVSASLLFYLILPAVTWTLAGVIGPAKYQGTNPNASGSSAAGGGLEVGSRRSRDRGSSRVTPATQPQELREELGRVEGERDGLKKKNHRLKRKQESMKTKQESMKVKQKESKAKQESWKQQKESWKQQKESLKEQLKKYN